MWLWILIILLVTWDWWVANAGVVALGLVVSLPLLLVCAGLLTLLEWLLARGGRCVWATVLLMVSGWGVLTIMG